MKHEPHRRTSRARPRAALLAGLCCAGFAAGAPVEARAAVQLPGRADASPAPVPAAPRWTRGPERGFFDDLLAVDPSGRWLAIIRTDSASFAQIEVLDLGTGRVELTIPAGDPQQLFDRLVFTGQGRGLVLVTRQAQRGHRTAQRFDDAGRPAGVFGPAAHMAFVWRGEQHYLVARGPGVGRKGASAQVVTVHDLADGKPVGKPRVLAVTGDGLVKLPPGGPGEAAGALRVLAWLDGGARLFGVLPGGYDKTRDVRTPDRAALHDVLRGQLTFAGEIEDVLAWSAVSKLRERHPDRVAFLEPGEDQSSLWLLDALGRGAPLRLVEPFENYDPRSLQVHEETRDDRLYFSLQVEPLNPRALLRKKAEPSRLDLYSVAAPAPGDPRSAEVVARALLHAPADERPLRWAVGPGAVVVLRKFKAFARGGDLLEVYPGMP